MNRDLEFELRQALEKIEKERRDCDLAGNASTAKDWREHWHTRRDGIDFALRLLRPLVEGKT